MSDFTYKASNTLSIVLKNQSNKAIRIFDNKINPGAQMDLMKIPGVSEEDIRASLLKGRLGFLINSNQAAIISSDLNLEESSINNFAALVALDDGAIPDGSVKFVNSVRAQFTLNKSSNVTADGITVLTLKSGTGRWHRIQSAQSYWEHQTTWHVNAVSGSNENDGSSESTAIKSVDEFLRRMPSIITQQITVWIDSDIVGDQTILLNGKRGTTAPAWVSFTGKEKPTLHSGTVTAFQAADPSSKKEVTITDSGLGASGFSDYVGKIVRFSSGVRGVIIKDLGSKMARLSLPMTYSYGYPQDPVVSDTYEILDLVRMDGHIIAGGVCEIDFEALDMGIVDEEHSVEINGLSFFESCVIRGFDSDKAGQAGLFNCYVIGNCRAQNFSNVGVYGGAAISYKARAGGRVQVSGCTAQGGGYYADAGGQIETDYGWAAAFDGGATPAAIIEPGGKIVMSLVDDSFEPFWGKGFTGTAVDVLPGGMFIYGADAVPGVTTSGNEVSVGGTVKTFAAIDSTSGFMNTVNGALVAPR